MRVLPPQPETEQRNMGHPASIRESAVKYMRQQLGDGKSLSKILLDTVDFDEGSIVTLSPTPLDPTQTLEFDWGHAPQSQAKPEYIKIGDTSYVAFPKTNANEQLIELIYNNLEDRQGLCLLENYLFEAAAPWLKRAKSRVITKGSEVYHGLFSIDRDKAKIEAAIREWHHLPTFIGALGSMNEEVSAHIASVKAITAEQFTAFAKTAQSVFVGAYDGEGYVVWNKPSG